jgi:hypothetical protein
MTNCKNCNEPTDGKYCSNCGHPVQLKRIDGHYILHEIEHLIHFERGVLYTIKELLIRPGKTVREFISDNRNRLVKPIIFIIITSLIYTLVIHFFHDKSSELIKIQVDEGGPAKPVGIGVGLSLFKWAQQHYGYFNILWGLFVAFWAKIFFRKYPYNYFEIMILLCFVQGIFMLILTFDAVFVNVTHLKFRVGSALSLAYVTWAIGDFFDKKKLINYVKALASYMLGLITLVLLLVSIASLIDLIVK